MTLQGCMAGSGDSTEVLASRLIAAGFDSADVQVIAGRLLLRCERRRAEVPDHHESGRSHCRVASHPLELGFCNGEINTL
jgi:hypothetical protein